MNSRRKESVQHLHRVMKRFTFTKPPRAIHTYTNERSKYPLQPPNKAFLPKPL